MREAQDYIMLEKAKEVRERVNSSRPVRNSWIRFWSPVPEKWTLRCPLHSGNRNLHSSRLMLSHNSAGSTDSGFGQPTGIDVNYTDPLGPQPIRLKNWCRQTTGFRRLW
ncbi:hypothetical protein NQ317_017565 [Molorchus minor]|uniref:Uncharacterized protein n=1 Tax=Molorchus minor TaxID=1323400 RepID=A0ABQ9J7Y2_9CUCU|nr:hypothetical protein NQ317_017565 [Molorchus minor]